MGMRFVSTNKRMIAFRRLIAPIIWFNEDSNFEHCQFRAHTEKPDTIIGHWAEDMSPYEITCPPQLREAFIAILNLAHKIYFR